MANQNAAAQTESDHTLRWGEAVNDSEYQKKPTLSAVRNVTVRKTNSDRTSYAQPDTTRNVVRRSTMPGTPQNEPDSFYPTTDKTFTKQYEQSYAERQQAALQQKAPAAVGAATPTATRQAAVTYRQDTTVAPSRTTRRSKKKKEKASLATKGLARVRATAVNTWIYATALPLWMTVQIPFALINLGFLAAATVVAGFRSYIQEKKVNGNLMEEWIAKTVDYTGEQMYDLINTITPVELNNLLPENLFAATNAIVFGYGMILLLLIFIGYKLARLNPLLGDGAGLKMGCFLIALIGYSFPILNLLPWFVPWTIAVWIYPK